MLGNSKSYVVLALNCILNNSKKIILVLEIKKKDRNNSIKIKSTCECFLWLIHS